METSSEFDQDDQIKIHRLERKPNNDGSNIPEHYAFFDLPTNVRDNAIWQRIKIIPFLPIAPASPNYKI